MRLDWTKQLAAEVGEKLLHFEDILRIKPVGFRDGVLKKKKSNDSGVWDLNNVEMRKIVGGAVWRWGSEFGFGPVWDTSLKQREVLNRWLELRVWRSESKSRMKLLI